jgi:apolipoprotein D and lipocalin family protein
MFLKYFLLCCLSLYSYCISRLGRCPSNFKAEVTNFSLTAYLGRWYEIARMVDFPYESGECNRVDYFPKPNGFEIKDIELRNNTWVTVLGDAVATNNPVKLQVAMGRAPRADYYILDTDYKSYAVVSSCTSHGLSRTEYVWIISRTPTIDTNRLNKVLDFIKKRMNIDKRDLHFTYQGPEICGVSSP